MAGAGNEQGQGLQFLRGGGELGELTRRHDWANSPLGPPERWPQGLKTAIRIMLASRQPIWIGWGSELTYFYNDAYKSIIGGKHPWAIGRPTEEVWEEIWDDISPMLDKAMAGEEGTYVEAQLLVMERSGYPEETYYTFSYSPIPAEDGSAGGIICANTDDTRRVIGERQLALLRELGAQTADTRTWSDTCRSIELALATDPRDLTFALLYMSDPDRGGHSLAAACGLPRDHPAAPPRIGEDGSPWPLAEVLGGDASVLLADCDSVFEKPQCSAVWGQPTRRAALLPVPASGEQGRSGVLIVGLNPYRLFDDNYRSFLNLAAGQIAAALANAEAYEAERRRAEALAELDRTKTAFFSNISHEFRTPLTLMLGPLEDLLAKPDASLAPDDRALADLAQRNGLRLMKLVNALLDFSRIEAGRIQASYRPTDLAAYTAEIASGFRSATEKAGLGLVVDTRQLSQRAYVDCDMWEKIVLNLVSNAFKFTIDGEIRVALSEVKGSARLTVSDTGIGIAEDELPRLFERFHRVEGAKGRSFEGSGIGLALVQELARLHGGEVSVRSKPGRGSSFTVTIPLGREHLPPERIVESDDFAAAPHRTGEFVEEALRWLPASGEDESVPSALGSLAPDDAAPAPSPLADRPRIVLADDNADMRDYIRRLLSDRFEVEAVADGEAALAAIRREPPELLLTDVMMPRLDGFGLLRTIRADEALAGLAVVMLSARAGEEAQIEGIQAGADDYLVKPFSARELIARVSTNVQLSRTRRQAESALRRLNEQLSAETRRLNRLFQQAPMLMAVLRGPDHLFELANPACRDLFGSRELLGRPIREELPEIGGRAFPGLLDEVRRTGQPFVGQGMTAQLARGGAPGTEERVLDFVLQPLTDADGAVTGILVLGSDVTGRVRAETMRTAQNEILRAALQETPLESALEALVRTVESMPPSGMIGSVLLLDDDGRHLRHGAAPSLPKAYNDAIDGIEIGPAVGSCGTAAHTMRPVYVSDIASDPLWADFRDLTLAHGLRACWSTPILTANCDLLGTFAIYFRDTREPSAADVELIDFVTRSAALLIERKRAEIALHDQTRVLETLNRIGAAIAGELNLERVVQLVTDAGTELTGAQFGSFFYNVFDSSGEAYTLFTISGVERSAFENFPMPRKTEIFAPTFTGAGVVRSDDITADPRYGRNPPHSGMPEGHLPVRSYLAVPVVSRSGEAIGGLFFGHAEKGRFSERHEELVVGIAGHAATAIDNARLYDAAQREIGERRVAEDALRELNQSLEERVAAAIAERERIEDVLRHAQKMEAVGQLTGGIAHDFNNLLTIITGNVDMALRSLESGERNPRLQRALGNALNGAERAAALTQRLLAFSRRQPLAPQPLDVDKLILGMSELLKRTLGETIQLETITAPGLWRVEVDPNQLESALLNLAVNARDAMPEGGKLTIETANARLDEEYSAGHAEVAPGSYVVIAVSDTGTGMSKETLARVFEPFFTTKDVGKGTGLGLSMVYGFVKQSGGHVKIYSEEDEGTTVKVYLPRLVGSAAEGDGPSGAPVADRGSQDETILVVEDDDDVRAYTVEILRELGYRVLEAHDGPAALRLLERPEVEIDLLFTDIVMPAMSGRELADAARETRPRLKVLYTSGYTRNAIVHGGRLDPGVEMIAKPFTYQDLAARVRDLLDAGNTGRLLLVEADPGIRILTAEAMSGAGHAVDEAATSAEALGKVRASNGGYDAVVLDYDLPDGRGEALAQELRALRADLPLLIASAQDVPERSQMADDRCTAWLRKPYNIDALQRALTRLGVACRSAHSAGG